jgi:putative flippase GtrA
VKAVLGDAAPIFRFALVGLWNTIFGWLTFAGLYYATRPPGPPSAPHYLAVLAAANGVAVMQAYVSYKYIVFRTTGNVVREFVRFSTVYVGTFAVNLAALPILVAHFGVGPVPAQAAVIAICAVASYFGHSRLSFRLHAGPRVPVFTSAVGESTNRVKRGEGFGNE